jgi:hypothetical protein
VVQVRDYQRRSLAPPCGWDGVGGPMVPLRVQGPSLHDAGRGGEGNLRSQKWAVGLVEGNTVVTLLTDALRDRRPEQERSERRL